MTIIIVPKLSHSGHPFDHLPSLPYFEKITPLKLIKYEVQLINLCQIHSKRNISYNFPQKIIALYYISPEIPNRLKFGSSLQKMRIFRYKSKLFLNLIINSYPLKRCKIEEAFALSPGNILRLVRTCFQPFTFATSQRARFQSWKKTPIGTRPQNLQQLNQIK